VKQFIIERKFKQQKGQILNDIISNSYKKTYWSRVLVLLLVIKVVAEESKVVYS
jgi:hypothetical protein